MDFSKFKTSDWLKVGGGVGMLIFGFFNWGSISAGPVSVGWNAFSFFFRGTVPWLLTVAVGALAFLLATGKMKPGKQPWALIMLGASALATLLNLIIVVFGPSIEGHDIPRSFGLYPAFLSVAACFAGCLMGFKESGGDLNDLKDMNKIKGAFNTGNEGNSGDSDLPPPPPPPPPMPG